ncbi:TetR/AcrR family transcriptional regulator [Streptomyces sp. 8L]|uniref:TetR/AcrR family transcriptional regulator n=1 Tax=Streptomyces sp. 8L TaxID=2877242 RepID=UPI001CD23B1D|nr:TetR/AcrR family transcriptional regulator [Streptomyces sp. 8L]MCA1222065.1 TetR family transcriptional regulator [Streptomyces sp. 8L]
MAETGRSARPRARDAAATRRALLDAAAELFFERGFNRTTVRDIADRAGANQSLIFRYFGSKAAVFEAVAARLGHEQLDRTPAERLLDTTLRSMLRDEPGRRRDHTMVTFLRSLGTEGPAADIAEQLGDDYTEALAALTAAPDARLRAQLVLAWLVGISLVRDVSRIEPLSGAGPDEVTELILRAARTLLEGTA